MLHLHLSQPRIFDIMINLLRNLTPSLYRIASLLSVLLLFYRACSLGVYYLQTHDGVLLSSKLQTYRGFGCHCARHKTSTCFVIIVS